MVARTVSNEGLIVMGKWDDHVDAVNSVLKQRGMSKYELAQKVSKDMSENFLYTYLRGKTGINRVRMRAINKILGIRFTDE